MNFMVKCSGKNMHLSVPRPERQEYTNGQGPSDGYTGRVDNRAALPLTGLREGFIAILLR